MGKEAIVKVEIEADLYNQAEQVLNKQGYTVEEAVVLFLKTVIKCSCIPFEYKKGNACGV